MACIPNPNLGLAADRGRPDRPAHPGRSDHHTRDLAPYRHIHGPGLCGRPPCSAEIESRLVLPAHSAPV